MVVHVEEAGVGEETPRLIPSFNAAATSPNRVFGTTGSKLTPLLVDRQRRCKAA